jgi:uncharacterized protein YkwD
MPKSRVRKGRKPYRPRGAGGGTGGSRLRPVPASPAPASPVPAAAGTVAAPDRERDWAVPVSDEMTRFQRRVIGSDAWRRRIEDEVTALVNAERGRLGLVSLRADERLRRSARAHSADMAGRGYFSHQAPDGTGPADRIRAAGYPAPAGENIAAGQDTPAEVVRCWMNSAGHRAAILAPRARAIGVGLHDGPRRWWTQHFGHE